MIPPKAHELRERISLVTVKSPFGTTGIGTIEATFKTGIAAKFEPLGGSTLESTQEALEYAQDYNVWIRYINGVTAFMQAIWQTRNNVQLLFSAPPEEMENKRWLLLHCQEIKGKQF